MDLQVKTPSPDSAQSRDEPGPDAGPVSGLGDGKDCDESLRRKHYFGNQLSAAWRLDLEAPIPLDLSVQEQIDALSSILCNPLK